MQKVNLFVIRETLRSKAKIFLIICILAAGVSVYVGTIIGLRSVKTTAEVLYRKLSMADAGFFFTPLLKEELPLEDIGRSADISKVGIRLVVPGSVELGSGRFYSALFIFLDAESAPSVNMLQVLSGQNLADSADEIVLDAGFAQAHRMQVGDHLTVGIQGFFTTVRIRGIGISPDFLLPNADPNFFYTIRGSLAVVYLPMRVIEEMFGYAIYNNINVVFNTSAHRSLHELEASLKNAGIDIDHTYRREELYSHRKLEYDITTYSQFLPTIIGVFDSIALLITMVIMRRMVYARRREIGALMALGCSLRTILWSYLRIGIVLSFAATVIGFILAWPISYFVIRAYQNATGFPVVFYSFSVTPFLSALLLSIVTMVLASVSPFLRFWRMTPAQMLREHDSAGLTKFSRLYAGVERMILSIIPGRSSVKIGIRNALRQRGTLLAWITFTSLSLGLSFTFLLFNTSMYQSVINYFSLNVWDFMVIFDKPVGMDHLSEIRNLENVQTAEPFLKGFVRMSCGNRDEYYQLVGVPLRSELRKFDLLRGTDFTKAEAKEIIINKKTSDLCGIDIGESLSISSKKRTDRLHVAGVTNNYTIGQGYVLLPISQDLLNMKDMISGCFVRAKGDLPRLEKKLMAKNFVSHVIRKTDVQNNLWAAMKEITTFLWLYFVLAAMCCIFLIYAGTTFSVLDHEEEYATLRALGYGRKWIAEILFSEVAIVICVSFILCLPVAYGLSQLFAWRIAQTNVYIPIFVKPSDYFIFFSLFVVIFITSVFPALRYIEKLDLPSILRKRDVG